MSRIVENAVRQPTPIGPIRKARLSLTPPMRAGEVRQRLAHGRSKAVTVEVKRRRSPSVAPRAAESAGDHGSKQGTAFLARPNTAAAGRSVAREVAAGSQLTEAERAARMRAFELAWNEERRRQAEQQAEEQRRVEAEAADRHAAEEEAKRQAEAAAKLAAEEAARRAREETRRVPAETDDEGLGAVAGEIENRDHASKG